MRRFKIDQSLSEDDQTSVICAKAAELGMKLAVRMRNETFFTMYGVHFDEALMRSHFRRGADARAYFRSLWSNVPVK